MSHQLQLSGIEQALAQFVGEAGSLGEMLGWFGSDATAMLQAHETTRVQADPLHGQSQDFALTTQARYRRLHGSPKV